MNSISVKTSSPYSVLIGRGLLSSCGAEIRSIFSPCRLLLVSDDRVMPLYGATVEKSLREAGFEVFRFVFPAGENSKTPDTVLRLLKTAAEYDLSRTDLFVALGGGVVGDLAGFAASVYLRGISFVSLPTTVLSAVDSSVGGKTGVDLADAKNAVGTFWQPSLVLCDPDSFSTLPSDVFSDGIAECIKTAMIADKNLFALLSDGKAEDRIEEIISSCVKIKSNFVAADERDRGARRLLNFGHTVGHAVEAASGYSLSHGKAVAIGMNVVSSFAEREKIASPGTAGSLRDALIRYGLPTESPFDGETLLKLMKNDKKRSGDRITLVLPRSVGEAFLKEIPFSELGKVLTD